MIDPRRLALRLAVCAGVAAAALGFAPWTYDDAYITYRYADNLARGHGFVFNPGEVVLGTSAPGYGLVLAGLARLTGLGVDLWGAALSLAALATIALVGPALRAGLSTSPSPRPDLVDAVFAVLVLSARWNLELLGGEALPATALIGGSALLVLGGRPVAGGLAVGLAAALRADALLAMVALAGLLGWERRRPPWSFLVAGAAPVGLVAAWLMRSFGTIWPVTAAGKRSEMVFATSGYSATEWGWLARDFSTVGGLLLVVAASLGLARVLGRAGRARRWLAVTLGWLAAHELVYRCLGVPFAPWYHLGALQVLLGLAAAAGGGPGRRRASLVLIVPAVLAAGAFWRDHLRVPPDPRLRVHRDVVVEITRRAPPGASVAAVEIGALAYFSDHPVIDLTGLVDPALRQARIEGRLAAAVVARAPDFVVDNPAFHGQYLSPLMGELARGYREVARCSRPEYPFELRLLQRRGEGSGTTNR